MIPRQKHYDPLEHQEIFTELCAHTVHIYQYNRYAQHTSWWSMSLFKIWTMEGHTFLVDMNEITWHYDNKYALLKSLCCVMGCTIRSLINCSTLLFCRTICKHIPTWLNLITCSGPFQIVTLTYKWKWKHGPVRGRVQTSQVCHSGGSMENIKVE
jgi:hypothetical protein